MSTYTITEMANEFGVTLRTLRFYELRKMLSPARIGPTRSYSRLDREALRKILKWRAQGFTLTEIKVALDNGGFPPAKIEQQIQHLRAQRIEIDRAIAELIARAA